MPKRYFGTDGIRGEFGVEPLTNEFFIILGLAIGRSLLASNNCKKKVIFGCDTRESCSKIIDQISIGLQEEGCEIHNTSVVPTPAIAFYTKKENYDLGIMVSASHNLYKDNGIKIFNKDGFKISIDDENHIEDYIENIKGKNIKLDYLSSSNKLKNINISNEYIDFCLKTIKSNNTKMHLTLDLANGSNYNIAPKVFKKAGYDISVINDKPNGININDKCGSTYLNDLPSIIKGNGSKFAISMDGDGDRLLVVNEDGKVLDGDDILYTIIKGKNILNENIKGVVGTTMTNYAFEKFLKEEGIDFIRANVGDKNVMEKMLKNNYVLGGEASGHILMLDNSSSGDSIIAALQFLYYSDILNKKSINSFLKKYPQKITNLLIDKYLPENIINIAIKEASDKFSNNDLRLIIRKSGTENCIRIMVEAKEVELVNSASKEIKYFIKDKLTTLLS